MSGGIDKLRAAVTSASDARYQPSQAVDALLVKAVERDQATRAQTGIRGTVGGQGDFYVPMRGKAAGVGDVVLVGRAANDPTAPYEYVRHLSSLNPASGLVTLDPDLPIPTWAGSPYSTALVTSPGRITARLSIFFNAIEGLNCSGYTVSFRPTGQEWHDLPVPHLGGVQECNLGSDFNPGTAVDVKIRARFAWSLGANGEAESLPSELRTFTTAADNASPGAATALAVSVTTPGSLVLTATGTVTADIFAGWQYEIAATNGGATIASAVVNGPFVYSAAPGDYYAKVRPISKSGVLGTPYPGTNHVGPFAIAAYAGPLDTTPPPQWAAPTLAQQTNQPNNGGEEYWLTVTLNTNASYPTVTTPAVPNVPDYDYTIVNVSGTGFAAIERIDPGQSFIKMRVQAVGLLSVTVQGIDKLGNRGTASTAATITINPTGVPASAPVLTGVQRAMSASLTWTFVANTLAYELQRAPDVAGAPGTFGVFPLNDTLTYVDLPLGPADTAPVTYWYRVRAWNLAGYGTFSNNVQVIIGKLHGLNLVADSVTAAVIAGDQAYFNKVMAGKIFADIFKTAASGARWELHGATGGANAGKLLWYDGSNVTIMDLYAGGLRLWTPAGVLRAELTPTGIYVKHPSGTTDQVALDSSGLYVRNAANTHAIDVYDNGVGGLLQQFTSNTITGMTINTTTKQRVAMLTTGWIERFEINGTAAYFDLKSITSSELGLIANAATKLFTVGNADMKVHRGSTVGFVLLGDQSGGTRALGYDGTHYSMDGTGTAGATNLKLQNMDLMVHRGSAIGVVFLGNQAGGQRLVDYDGTEYVMPNANLRVNGTLVPSGRDGKRDIRDVAGVRQALRQIRARRFKRLEHGPDAPDELGFVAEEVAPLLPDAVRQPDASATELDGSPVLPAVNPLALLAILWRGVQEIAEETEQALATARQERDDLAAQLAALAARVAAIEGGGALPVRPGR